jgi:hypothetical protein
MACLTNKRYVLIDKREFNLLPYIEVDNS